MTRAELPETDDAPLSSDEEARLLAALEAALRPAALEPRVNERAISLALDDPLAAPTDAELASAERLRHALDDRAAHEDAALLEALRPVGLASARAATERAVERALPEEAARPARRPTNVIFVVFGAAGALSAAAALLLLATRVSAPEAARHDDVYARPRSTAPLFGERFETGATTLRVDLIATSRGRELRDNRYAAWGVR